MALHPDFPDSPHAVIDPELRCFPADGSLRETTMDNLIPSLRYLPSPCCEARQLARKKLLANMAI